MEQLPGLILQLYITSSQNPLCYDELAGGAREDDDDERSDFYCVIMIYCRCVVTLAAHQKLQNSWETVRLCLVFRFVISASSEKLKLLSYR